MKNKIFVVSIFLSLVIGLSCSKEEQKLDVISPEEPPSEMAVSFDLQTVPYTNLSDYHFFNGNIADLIPNNKVLPYDLITPLFSDYAEKSRFIWMPAGVSATYESDNKVLNFPDGTVMIKNFYYDNVQPEGNRKILETRLIYKKNGAWVFADYTWNDDQTGATYSLTGSFVPVQWIDKNDILRNVDFRIPPESECFTCHKVSNMSLTVSSPIGPKPQNLNRMYNYGEGEINQLGKWVEEGYLESYPSDINTVVAWDDSTQLLKDRVRAYLDMNCSHCHQQGSHCSYRPLRFAYSETAFSEDSLGVCIEPQEFIPGPMTHIIARGNPTKSVLYFRLNSTQEQFRMPLLGRSVVHEEAVALVSAYINSLSPVCP
jgi:uncharacterized repeat protein (TIGR03806 family)